MEISMANKLILTTIEDVIDLLGGIDAVAEFTGRGYTAVHNWRREGRFPASLYLKMTRRLKRRKAAALPSLWGQEGVEFNVAA
jgi:hypothetical protein